MGLASRRKIWAGTAVFLLALVLFGLFLIRREAYELNKNARLVSWRIVQFQELARHRKLTYKIEFLTDRMTVSRLITRPEEHWKAIASFLYENSLQTTLPGFTLILEKGRTISYQWEGSRGPLRSAVVLGFFDPRNPSRKKGILFLKNGDWRTL